MATVNELYGLWQDTGLRNHAEVCVVMVALEIQSEDPAPVNHAERLVWAKEAFTSSRSVAVAMVKYLLATNSALTAAQLEAAIAMDVEAANSPLLAAIRAAVDVFAGGV